MIAHSKGSYDPARPASLRPAPLRSGDRVAVIAPCSPFPQDRFERGLAALGSIGLQAAVPAGLDARFPPGEAAYLAGDDAHRLEQLRAALGDESARAIILARGGYGLLRLASQLSASEFSARPRLLCGYSDATVLHELSARAGVPSIHGPMCTQLGEDQSALARLRALLCGEPPGAIAWEPMHPAGARPAGLDEDRARSAQLGDDRSSPARLGEGRVEGILRGEGRTEGVLRGGNLAVLASLCGTALSPRFSGCILLLEDLNEPPYRLDRLLTQLLLAGALDGVRGVVVGDLSAAGEPGAGRAEAVLERLSGLAVPIAFGAPFGHAGRNQPVAFGVPHALDAAAGTLTPLDSPTSPRATG